MAFHKNETNSLVEKFNLNWSSFGYLFNKHSRFSPAFRHYLFQSLIGKKDTLLHSHTQWNYVPFTAYRAALKFGIPLVVSVRGVLYKDALKKSALKKAIVMKLFQKSMFQDATILHVTEPREAIAVREHGIKTPLALIPNGVDQSEFDNLGSKDDSKDRLGLDKSKNYILFMGSIHPHKGVEIALNAFIEFYEKYPDWNFLIAGPYRDLAYTNRVKDIVRKHKLEDKVLFLGMVTDEKRIDVFNASSLLISPTVSENFGLSISEAMAAGLPVITTQGTPWQGILENNLGWWVELNQDNINSSLGAALNEGTSILAEKGQRARNYVKRFSWQEQANKMKKVYEFALYGISDADIIITD